MRLSAKKNPSIRVRFAPSPTGFLHVGSLRTALYNYLFARQKKGVFVLRIEDTDQKRTIPGALEGLLKTLAAVGLEWDEGPEKGEFGPYIQSQRLEIYKKYVAELVKKGKAYYCFCSEERLEKLRQVQQLNKQPTMYDGLCRKLTESEIKQRLAKKEPPVIRLSVPEEGRTKFKDIIRGEVEFENKLIDDQVLLKSDGYPTYHLANVVDDYLMKITHVIRGEEWLSSMPKHILLYQALGWETPQFAHLSLLLNPDRSKLSKRQGDVAVEDYLKKGYLPEALLNFVALLGWSSAKEPDREIFNLPELVKEFSLERISQSGAIFNLEKLDWMNGHYIRQKPIGELVELCVPYLVEAGLVKKSEIKNLKSKINAIIKLEQERLIKLSDLPKLTEYFFRDPDYPAKLLIWRKSDAQATQNRLFRLFSFYDTWRKKWDAKSLEQGTLAMIKKENLDNGATLWPMRAALSGREASPGPFEIAEILGRDKTVKRLKKAWQTLEATRNLKILWEEEF